MALAQLLLSMERKYICHKLCTMGTSSPMVPILSTARGRFCPSYHWQRMSYELRFAKLLWRIFGWRFEWQQKQKSIQHSLSPKSGLVFYSVLYDINLMLVFQWLVSLQLAPLEITRKRIKLRKKRKITQIGEKCWTSRNTKMYRSVLKKLMSW